MMFVYRLLMITVSLALCMCTQVHAAFYYVSTTGSGSTCSLASPCGSVQTGIGKLVAGDTLYLRGGTYTQSIRSDVFAIPSGTSWSNKITIASYPGETATLTASSVIVLIGSYQYIEFANLVIDGSPATSTQEAIYYGAGVHHIRITGGHIQNAGGQGHQNGLAGVGLEYLNIKVHDNGRNPSFDGSANHGFYVSAPGMLIDGCEFYNHNGYGGSGSGYYGLQVYYSGGGPSHNVDSVIRNNYIHDNLAGATLNMSTNLLFYNNIVVNNSSGGVSPIAYGNPTGTLIYFNTIAFNGGIGLEMQSGASGTIAKNNIITNNDINVSNLGSGTTFGNNLCNVSGTGCNVIGNAGFINSGANNYNLLSSSIAIDAGVCIGSVTFDYARLARPQGSQCDIGAYEFATGVSPTEFYVSKTGSDSNSCSAAANPATRKLTITAAIACMTIAGSKVHIGPGTYAESIDDMVQFIPSGTSWSTATIIEAETALTVVLTLPASTNVSVFMRNATTGRFIVLDGLVLDGQSIGGTTGLVYYPGTDHIRFQNGEIHHFDTGVYIKQSNNSEVLNTKVHDILSGHAVMIGSSTAVKVQTSELYNVFGSGVEQIASASNSTLDISRNRIHDIGTGGSYAAVVLQQGNDALVSNNVIYNCDAGVDVQTYSNTKVYSNTVYGCSGIGIHVNVGASATLLTDNIVFGNGTNVSNAGSGTVQTTNFTTDPLFTNAAGGDFTLLNNSAAIDAGTTLVEVPNDIINTVRPQRTVYTIGAYEFVGVPNVPPPPPGTLVYQYVRSWMARGFFAH